MKVIENKGGYVTAEGTDIKGAIISEKVYLSDGEDESKWRKISKEEGDKMLEMQRIANDLDSIEKIDKTINDADTLPLVINDVVMTDEESLARKRAYPLWSKCVGQNLRKGYKVQHEDKLFRVVQAHTVQAHFPPSEATASLYEEINVKNKGSKDDPIPYSGNMRLELGKYYTQNGKKYECIRDTGNPVYEPLSKLLEYGFVKLVGLTS